MFSSPVILDNLLEFHRLGGLNNRNEFLTILEAQSPITVPKGKFHSQASCPVGGCHLAVCSHELFCVCVCVCVCSESEEGNENAVKRVLELSGVSYLV